MAEEQKTSYMKQHCLSWIPTDSRPLRAGLNWNTGWTMHPVATHCDVLLAVLIAVTKANGENSEAWWIWFERVWIFQASNYRFHTLTGRASMDTIPGLRCWIRTKCSPERCFRSKHCFAESCDLIEQTMVWQYMLNRTKLVCHTHSTLCVVCMWFSSKFTKYFSRIPTQLTNCYLWKFRPTNI